MTSTPYSKIIICLLLALLLNACAWVAPFLEPPSNLKKADSTSIGPYPVFSGRLIVIEPSRRWQVSIDWQAPQPETGKLRLSHAITGTVVDFRWMGTYMQIRDDKFPHWRHIEQQELSEHGLALPPPQLANILLGQIPSHFKPIKPGTWESNLSGNIIRLHWQPQLQQLTISDIDHGRIAKLIIRDTD